MYEAKIPAGDAECFCPPIAVSSSGPDRREVTQSSKDTCDGSIAGGFTKSWFGVGKVIWLRIDVVDYSQS